MDHHWLTDFLALGQSEADGTPAVLHGLYSHDSARAASEKMDAYSLPRKPLEGLREIVSVAVPLPESEDVVVHRSIELITVQQVATTAKCAHLKHKTVFHPNYILGQSMFGMDDVTDGMFATLILGEFTLEQRNLPPKLLLARMNGMLANEIYSLEERKRMAEGIYCGLRPICGKMGYEMRRFGGSSGKVNVGDALSFGGTSIIISPIENLALKLQKKNSHTCDIHLRRMGANSPCRTNYWSCIQC